MIQGIKILRKIQRNFWKSKILRRMMIIYILYNFNLLWDDWIEFCREKKIDIWNFGISMAEGGHIFIFQFDIRKLN